VINVVKEMVRDTEKPKTSGCFANSRFSKVDFPAPEGPETTIGREPAVFFSLILADEEGKGPVILRNELWIKFKYEIFINFTSAIH